MKILIVGLNWIGDVIMSFPAISEAAAAAGGAVAILTRPNLAPLYDLHPQVGDVAIADSKNFLWSDLGRFRSLRREKYDRVIVLPCSFRAALVGRMCGAAQTVGYSGQWRDFLLSRTVSLPADFDRIHESLLHLGLVRKGMGEFPGNGQQAAETKDLPGLPVPGFGSERVPGFLAPLGLERGSYVVMAPGAAFGPAKCWPPDRFGSLAAMVSHQTGLKVVISGTARETPAAIAMQNVAKVGMVDMTGKTDLPGLALLLAGSRLLVANDSGTMHLGALMGIPLVVPVGSTDLLRTGPLSKKAVIVSSRVSCSPPCREKTCRRGVFCMEAIGVPEMFEAVSRALEGW